MCFHKSLYAVNLASTKTATLLKSDRGEPKLGLVALTFHMNMRRFFSIARVKEKAIGSDSQFSWHLIFFLLPFLEKQREGPQEFLLFQYSGVKPHIL